jgi:hypothetical protein
MTREAKKRSLAYVRQDANVATGEFLFGREREGGNKKADVRIYCFFLIYANFTRKKSLSTTVRREELSHRSDSGW